MNGALARPDLAYLNAQIAQIEQAQQQMMQANQAMAQPNAIFNNPWMQFGGRLMAASDPRREGLGGLGQAIVGQGAALADQQRRQATAQLYQQGMLAQIRAERAKALEAQRRRSVNQAFVEGLPPEMQAAANVDPEAFAKEYAQAQYREPKMSTAQRIFQEMGGQAGVGKSFPDWYAQDYKTGGTTVNVGGVSEPVRKEILAQGNMEDALNRYEELLNEYGTETIPGEGKSRLRAAYTEVLLQAKEMANLGALTGPDLQLIQDTLSDPTDVTAAVRSTDVYKGQVDELRRKISRSRQRLMQTLPAKQRTAVQGETGGWNSTGSGARWREK